MRWIPASLGTVPINTSPFRVIYTISRLRPLFNHLLSFYVLFALSIFLKLGIRSAVRNYPKMRWSLALLLCCFLAAVNALSSSGSRLLVVLDESAEKSAYSTLWSDLEGN